MSESLTKENFAALTGFRAIAAYLVYLNHFAFFNPTFFSNFWFGYCYELYFGVTLFFVLSGFLIAYIYFDAKQFNFKNFMLKRFSRIYPMYFILTLLSFFYYSFFEKQSWKVFLLNITFLKSFFKDFFLSGLPTAWSLTVEESFYILVPIFFYFIRKSYIFIVAIPVVFFGFGILLVNFFVDFDFYGFFANNHFMYQFSLFGRISEFMIGIALAIFYMRKRNYFKAKYLTYFGLFSIIIGLYFLSLQKGNNFEGIDSDFGKILNSVLIPIFGIAPFYYGLITENTFISKILSSTFFQILGKSSYIFYLIHIGFVVTILYSVSKNHFFMFMALNLIAIILYKYVEKPLNNYFRNFNISKSPFPEP